MTETLVAHVNRSGLHSLEVPDTFETDGSFSVELRNHGEPTHVHLNLDDTLSTVASIDAPNHYVEKEATRTVDVAVSDAASWPREPLRGQLKIVTAYGGQTRYVTVELDQTSEDTPVEVDPELSKPATNPETAEPSPTLVQALPVAILGAVALILAVGAVFAAEGLNVMLAALAVLSGLLAAGAGVYLSR